MRASPITITQARLHELFDYKDGHLTRKQGQAAGRPAGTVNNRGYVRVQVDGKLYAEHRLIWLYCYNHPVPDILDHINSVKTDNRIENLQAASQQENCAKKLRARTGSLKRPWRGTYWRDGDRIYHAVLQGIYVGAHKDANVAAMIYNEAALECYGPKFVQLNDHPLNHTEK